MAFRSAEFRFANLSGRTLVRVQSDLDHGEYAANLSPPESIAPGGDAFFRAESTTGSILTGTEGTVGYSVSSTPVIVKLRWTVPAVGQSGGFFWSENDPAIDYPFVPVKFGFPLHAAEPGLYAFGAVDADGPIAPPIILNPNADIDVKIGLRDRRTPFSVKHWVRACEFDPGQGIRRVGARHDRPNFTVRTFVGPPPDWNRPIMS